MKSGSVRIEDAVSWYTEYCRTDKNPDLVLASAYKSLLSALKREHEWSEKLSKRIRDAVYASEELKDPQAFAELDEDFFNGVAASYEADYEDALKASK